MKDPAFERWFSVMTSAYLSESTDVLGEALTWNHLTEAFVTERSGGMAKASDWGEEVGRYNSTRDKTKIYTVRKYVGDPGQAREQRIGVYGCDCPGWRFSKDSPRTCVHVKTASSGPQLQRAERIIQLADLLNKSGLLANYTVVTYKDLVLQALKSKTPESTLNPLLTSAVGNLLTLLESSGLLATVDTSNDAKVGKTRLITLE